MYRNLITDWPCHCFRFLKIKNAFKRFYRASNHIALHTLINKTHSTSERNLFDFYFYFIQRLKMELMWKATQLGRCLTSLSGMRATLKDLACTMWILGAKINHATQKHQFSTTSASSARMVSPIRERYDFIGKILLLNRL